VLTPFLLHGRRCPPGETSRTALVQQLAEARWASRWPDQRGLQSAFHRSGFLRRASRSLRASGSTTTGKGRLTPTQYLGLYISSGRLRGTPKTVPKKTLSWAQYGRGLVEIGRAPAGSAGDRTGPGRRGTDRHQGQQVHPWAQGGCKEIARILAASAVADIQTQPLGIVGR